jgi:hypothetical protein
MRGLWFIVLLLIAFCAILPAQQAQAPAEPAAASPEAKSMDQSAVIPKGAKVFIAPMPNSFNEFLKTALEKKQVPVTIVEKREQADFEISGFSETQKAGAAKIMITGSWHSHESASIKVANLQSGAVAFAYAYNTDNSAHGKKSSAESCAKHLKEKIESGQ